MHGYSYTRWGNIPLNVPNWYIICGFIPQKLVIKYAVMSRLVNLDYFYNWHSFLSSLPEFHMSSIFCKFAKIFSGVRKKRKLNTQLSMLWWRMNVLGRKIQSSNFAFAEFCCDQQQLEHNMSRMHGYEHDRMKIYQTQMWAFKEKGIWQL